MVGEFAESGDEELVVERNEECDCEEGDDDDGSGWDLEIWSHVTIHL